MPPKDLADASLAALLPPAMLLADERPRRTIFSMISPLTNFPARTGGDADAMYGDGRDYPSLPAVVNDYDPPTPSGMCHGIFWHEHYSCQMQ